jgi:hypothetical protein
LKDFYFSNQEYHSPKNTTLNYCTFNKRALWFFQWILYLICFIFCFKQTGYHTILKIKIKIKEKNEMTKNKTFTLILMFAIIFSLIAIPAAFAQSDLIMNLPGPEGQVHNILTGVGTDIDLNGGPGPGQIVELWIKAPGDAEFQLIWTAPIEDRYGGDLDYYDYDFAVEGSYFLYWSYPGNTSISNIEEAVASPPTPITFPSFILLSVSPSPIGVGQTLFVNAFLTKPMAGAAMSIGGFTGNHYYDIFIDITRPDGTIYTIGPKMSDPVGGTWDSFIPSEVGTYTAQARYTGQDECHGRPIISGSYAITYLPDESPIMTFIVQEEPVGGWNTAPLPTEYWSRPITSVNWDWGSQLGSNWWGLNSPAFTDTGGYDATGNVQPYGKAPNSAHIMWTKSTQPGGQPGGGIPSDSEGQFTSTSILNRHWEPIILNGMLFYQHYPQPSNPRADQKWVAVDIRTGETLWERSRGDTGSETLRGGTIQKFHTIQEYGSFAYLWATGSGGMAYCYDAFTGALMAEVEGARWGSAIIDDHPDSYTQAGSLLRYYSRGGRLVMWNSSKMGFDNDVSGVRDWDDGIEWSIPWTDYPAGTPQGVRVTSNEIILLQDVPTYLGGYSYESAGYTTTAAVDARTGALLWGPITHTVPEMHDINMHASRDGVYVLHDKDLNELYGYSTENGQKLWGPVALPVSAWAAMEANNEVYLDYVIHWDFGGNVICLDKLNGTILWTWTRGSAAMETPYGIWPLWAFGSASFADGKIFLSEGSMYDVPLHPAKRIVLDAATGEEVWSILSYSGRAPGAIADGYMLEWNSLSGEIICFGKGPTAVSVSANPSVSVEGSSILVQGMVTDISPGTEVYEKEARFPQGVPAMSEKDQSKWMEYVYMQQPKPVDAIGVEVTLTVLDPNGNVYDVATATSDVDGFFKTSFIPQVPGEYTISASFAGSESYWPSDAKTAINVEQAPEATPGPTPTPASMTDTYLTGSTIAVIAAIAVVAFLLLRKK